MRTVAYFATNTGATCTKVFTFTRRSYARLSIPRGELSSVSVSVGAMIAVATFSTLVRKQEEFKNDIPFAAVFKICCHLHILEAYRLVQKIGISSKRSIMRNCIFNQVRVPIFV
jgi:hypothetical protein